MLQDEYYKPPVIYGRPSEIGGPTIEGILKEIILKNCKGDYKKDPPKLTMVLKEWCNIGGVNDMVFSISVDGCEDSEEHINIMSDRVEKCRLVNGDWLRGKVEPN